jgi:uronate dehydrogenase
VLVTGAGGLIGGILRDGLRDAYTVRGLDARPGRGVDVVADMSDLAAIGPAFEGVDAVVDLAANSDADASWDAVRANNLPATVNAFEAARLAGVRRVVFASSNHVVGMYERDEPYASVVAGRYDGLDPTTLARLDETSPIRPDGPYGIGKAFGEATARFYWEEHGISAVCLRIGTVNREGRPTNARHFATLLTHRDLVTLVRCCLAAPPAVGFAIVYGVSANTWRMWDIERARELIAYEPRDDAERWR